MAGSGEARVSALVASYSVRHVACHICQLTSCTFLLCDGRDPSYKQSTAEDHMVGISPSKAIVFAHGASKIKHRNFANCSSQVLSQRICDNEM